MKIEGALNAKEEVKVEDRRSTRRRQICKAIGLLDGGGGLAKAAMTWSITRLPLANHELHPLAISY